MSLKFIILKLLLKYCLIKKKQKKVISDHGAFIKFLVSTVKSDPQKVFSLKRVNDTILYQIERIVINLRG